MMQAHYSSVLDFSNEALLAAEKGHDKLLASWSVLQQASAKGGQGFDVQAWKDKCYGAMSDNFNSPILIAHLFEAVKFINTSEGGLAIAAVDLRELQQTFKAMVFDILALQGVEDQSAHKDALDKAMDLVIELRAQARTNKDWGTADLIRDQLKDAGIQLKDGPEGTTYSL